MPCLNWLSFFDVVSLLYSTVGVCANVLFGYLIRFGVGWVSESLIDMNVSFWEVGPTRATKKVPALWGAGELDGEGSSFVWFASCSDGALMGADYGDGDGEAKTGTANR